MQAEHKALTIRTVFMGTSFFAKAMLEALVEKQYNIVAVYTQPDKKAGRNQEIKPGTVKAFALEHNLAVYQPEHFDDNIIDQLKDLKPDIIVVAAYGKLLPKKVLGLPGFGCVNVHPSLLPKFRGPAPVQNAIMSGETETGISIMLLNEQMDAGDILAQTALPIDANVTLRDLFDEIVPQSAKLLIDTLPRWIERAIEPKPQNAAQASLCQLIEREDGHIIWEEDAQQIYNKFRALYEWPGIFSFWENDETLLRVKFIKISLSTTPSANHKVGEVFMDGDSVAVQALGGVIILEQLQLEGRNALPASDFVNGYPKFIGSVLK